MDGHLYIWTEIDALRQAKTIERLEYAFIVFAGARFTVIERSAEHISTACEWMNLSQTECRHLFQRRPSVGRERVSYKWRPAIGKLVLGRKAAAISAALILCIVSPHTNVEALISLTKGTGEPTHFHCLHILSINQRSQTSLRSAFRVDGNSMDIKMRSRLKFNGCAASVRSVICNRRVAVVGAI